ncbi:hypothetical protein JD844_004587 [Phrynosoma platyrhinos]|uniref:Phosphoribulokinase/uridine kinase domain-containing protein n=1 Tax=Phrynosoma platyrhinos TaxID=52577 RepID=A0ABQ7SDJ8_PHRPL|nr:hypothetical protein JD844_004587 [Phrynosoma platyrhinos]
MELLGQNEVDHRQRKVVILSQDRFYKVLTAEQKAKALKGQYNFDHPDAFDNELMQTTLKNIVDGQTVEVPTYDFVTHSRCIEIYVVLFEGILVFYNQDIRDMFHLRLFVDTDSDVRLSRRVAINLIVQHIQDILSGDLCKWQRGAMNGHGRSSKRPFPEQADSPLLAPGKRSHLESSSRPH